MDIESKKEDNKLMATTSMANHDKGRRKKKKKICIWSCVGLILFLAILITILALTVFKTKKPITTVDSVSLQDFKVSFDIVRATSIINITLDVDLTIKNPNRVGFKYSSSSALIKYRDQVVGEAPIPAGEIGSRSTSPMNISLTVMADRLLSNGNIFSDGISGTLPFTTDIKLDGKVQFLFKIKVTIYTTCDINVNIAGQNVTRENCHYRTKL